MEWMRTWPSPVGGAEQVAGRVAFFARCGKTGYLAPGGQLEMVASPDDVLATIG